jgi:hypothetical protein
MEPDKDTQKPKKEKYPVKTPHAHAMALKSQTNF